jgi:GTP-binding protein
MSVDIFKKECKFIVGAKRLQDIPPMQLQEVAFIGRSNVGKSSLINKLVGQKKMARTSQTPGRTQQLNFFNLAEKIYLVDLPGYGYAKASKKDIEGWNNLIYQYLAGRPQLQRIFLLIDARHGVKPNDQEMLEFLSQSPITTQIVLTKIDKCTSQELEKIINSTQKIIDGVGICHPEILPSSSEKGIGIEKIKKTIASFI